MDSLSPRMLFYETRINSTTSCVTVNGAYTSKRKLEGCVGKALIDGGDILLE